METQQLKSLCRKALILERYFLAYNAGNETQRISTTDKFVHVWGTFMAAHFLSKYDNAESLISALDSTNFKLFVEKF